LRNTDLNDDVLDALKTTFFIGIKIPVASNEASADGENF